MFQGDPASENLPPQHFMTQENYRLLKLADFQAKAGNQLPKIIKGDKFLDRVEVASEATVPT